MEEAAGSAGTILVEATANQVNQFGGYTGMRPAQFVAFVRSLTAAAGHTPQKVLVGGDHIGPHPWRKEPAARAMAKAQELTRQIVAAGFSKIHLDTSAVCADDAGTALSVDTTAERAAALCAVAEKTADLLPARRPRPLYVIGVEVPPPGGALEDPALLTVTAAQEVAHTLEMTEKRFRGLGLEDAWERVVAIVVQPGVDFGDNLVAPYRPQKAAALSACHAMLPGIMTYEVHATDYQQPDALTQMVRDHFTLLKVGPCLTNAYREALVALAQIESDWLGARRGVRLSDLRGVLENVMLAHPQHWQSHYPGSAPDLKFLRQYSFRDRIRYYWASTAVERAVAQLLANLGTRIPPQLLSQYFPDLVPLIRSGGLRPAPSALIRQRIRSALSPYSRACRSVPIPRYAVPVFASADRLAGPRP
jgi:D-tagatose-1,6-bisphosphate aldolase subunit GatZ/KbaZ